jgi:hypothetical protein
MGAIWHDTGAPSFLGLPPSYSFHDLAEIVVPAPASYEQARARLQAWERRLGGAFYSHNAERAYELWQLKRPWWLV